MNQDQLFINGSFVDSVSGQTFGGYKQTGNGREFGLDGLNEYTEVKHLHVDELGTRAKKSWYDTVVLK